MRVNFEDQSFIEVSKSQNPDKIYITIAAKSAENSRQLVANSVELTKEQILALIRSVS